MSGAGTMALKEAQTEADTMLMELESCSLSVSLSGPIDSTGRKTRCVDTQNPAWYRDLFKQYHNGLRGKRSNTQIRRPRVLKALKALAGGTYRDYFIYNVLVDEIHDRISNGYYLEEYDMRVPPTIQLVGHP